MGRAFSMILPSSVEPSSFCVRNCCIVPCFYITLVFFVDILVSRHYALSEMEN